MLQIFLHVEFHYFLFSEHFKKVISRANLEPVKKYTYPQTEAQEVGWITRPLVSYFFTYLSVKAHEKILSNMNFSFINFLNL